MAFICQGKDFCGRGGGVLGLATGAQAAASCGKTGAGFEAVEAGVRRRRPRPKALSSKALAALAGANYATKTISVDRAIHKAFSGSVDAFMKRRGGAAIISKGRSLKKRTRRCSTGSRAVTACRRACCSPSGAWRPASAPPWATRTRCRPSLTLAYDCRRPGFFTRMPLPR